MNIHHRPIFDTDKVIEHYTKKDGVDIKYVCTSALGGEARAMDIFYRETPHPEFGNRYFGLFWKHPLVGDQHLMITNADKIESADFEMVEVNGQMHYSQHRHDYYTVGDVAIDGGRAYLRMAGNLNHPTKKLGIRDGEFYEKV